MRSLRVILSDRASAAAIALIAGCLMMFQAVAGNAAEIARAGGQGGIVLCSAGLAEASETSGAGSGHGKVLCAECCAVCHLGHAVALATPDRHYVSPVRLVASRTLRPSTRAPPRAAPRVTSTRPRGPPAFS